VDIPWSPYGVDGRWYDWAALAAAADLLFVMAYDTASQVGGRRAANVGQGPGAQ
jgi:di-N-acetylchitobiase